MTRSSKIPADAPPNPHATKEQVEAARHDSKLAQVLYHDWEAETYDEKWSISYDQRCVDYARDCFDGAVPDVHRLGRLALAAMQSMMLLASLISETTPHGQYHDPKPRRQSKAAASGARRAAARGGTWP